jgi:hypothetical protein
MILMKIGEEYKLYSHDSCIATTHESPHKRLSKQNCDEISNLELNEIEVGIEMENKQQLINGYKNQPDNVIGFIAEYENVVVPKLDENGCLILKKK